MNTQPEQSPSDEQNVSDKVIGFFTSPRFIMLLIMFYVLIIGLFLLGELRTPGFAAFRATDKIIILCVLMFLPFFIVAAPKFINTLTLKFGGGKEVEVRLNQVSDRVNSAVGEIRQIDSAVEILDSISKNLETRLARHVSATEQCLWPMLAGVNPFAEQRWHNDPPQIIIGSKEDVSHIFFAWFLKRWLERQLDRVEVVVRFPNGGSQKNFVDVKHRWVDMYIDFTGTCCQYFSIDHRHLADDKIVERLNEYCIPMGMKFLPMLSATENYLLVMRRETANKYNIESITDLSREANRLVFSADPEYMNRNDCWLGLQKTYGLPFREVLPCLVTDRYAFLADDAADVFVGYETDPEIQTHNLLVIEDNKHFFPNYAALPLVSRGLLDAVPAVREALNLLEGKITTEDLIEVVRELSDGIRSRDDIIADQELKVLQRIAEAGRQNDSPA